MFSAWDSATRNAATAVVNSGASAPPASPAPCQVILLRTANLAQAQPDAWGRVVAAVTPGAFLIAVSMIERRAARRARPAESQDGGPGELPPPGRPSPVQDEEDEALLAAARRAAAEHQERHGQPITRDALRARLGVSNQPASELLRQLRADEGRPQDAPRAAAIPADN